MANYLMVLHNIAKNNKEKKCLLIDMTVPPGPNLSLKKYARLISAKIWNLKTQDVAIEGYNNTSSKYGIRYDKETHCVILNELLETLVYENCKR